MNLRQLIDAANQLQTDCDTYYLKVQAQEKEIKELKTEIARLRTNGARRLGLISDIDKLVKEAYINLSNYNED